MSAVARRVKPNICDDSGDDHDSDDGDDFDGVDGDDYDGDDGDDPPHC